MTSQDLVRNKRHVEVLAARAELFIPALQKRLESVVLI